MTVDNRTNEDPSHTGGGGNSGSSSNQQRDDIVSNPLERLIRTKWADAKIGFKGAPPANLY